ncbi:hypothetical protein V7147_20445 [Bacillus sp. JJ1521]|uniref:hypothetical protein n=1 Tax=Bacillus sp. JJ1521 TaxID=3122957 RepID=UPI0030007853
MKRGRFRKYSYPQWLRQTRDFCAQFIIPITVVQAVRTIFIPTTIDVFFLAILIFLIVCIHLDWI